MPNKNKKSVYLTTTLPYINADPHIGFALEIVQADIMARYFRLMDGDVFFSTGTDEHGLKIYKKAEAEGVEIKDYVDEYAVRFGKLRETLNLSYDNFIRTTDERHIKAAQALWRISAGKGDIYKKHYKGLYCVGCECFIKESDLIGGKCPDHSNLEPEEIDEENYFFKFSNYQKNLLDYLSTAGVILPEWRRKEAIAFVEGGLEDFSISRLKEKMPWGIPAPGDDKHIMYVWFDALTSYISTLGWPDDKEGNFEKFWQEGRTLQFAGKDQIRFQSLIWQAMLMSAGLKNTDSIIYHGFITKTGQKMSKSLGNVASPFDIARDYGADALRYFLLRHINAFEDSDFTDKKFKDAYNAGLANGLGNLLSRVIKMAETYDVKTAFDVPDEEIAGTDELSNWRTHLEDFEFQKAADYIWGEIASMEKYIAESEPYKLIKEDEEKAKKIVAYLMLRLWDISVMLLPLLPETAELMQEYLIDRKVEKPLFERKD